MADRNPHQSGGAIRHGTGVPAISLAAIVVAAATALIALAVDAHQHAKGAGGQILGFEHPVPAVVGIALIIIAIVAAGALGTMLLRAVETPREVAFRFIPIIGAWLIVVSSIVGSLTYVAARDPNVAPLQATSDASGLNHQHPATDAGASTPTQEFATVHKHDQGQQPTFTQIETSTYDQLASQFPAGTMTAADYALFKSQLEQIHAFTSNIRTTADAAALGYTRATGDIPYMGEHWLDLPRVPTGSFDPARPNGLLFAKVDDGPPQLVGVWFLIVPGLNGTTETIPPVGFAGNLDLWHGHNGLCFLASGAASEDETREACEGKGGTYTAELRWMMHVWVVDGQENSGGVFHYLNSDLYKKQVAAGNTNPPLEAEAVISQ